MKKLILLGLISVGSIFAEYEPMMCVYRNPSTWKKVDSDFLKAMVICSEWFDEYVMVSFDQFEVSDIAIFRSYDCTHVFYVQCNRETYKLTIESSGDDHRFNFSNFTKIMETVLLND